MITKKLYDNDAYAVDFHAQVLSCVETKKGYAVLLDKTLFFPEEGGQSPDRGRLNDIPVTDVQIRQDLITHYTKQPLVPGDTVCGSIDWNHRFSNMQQHTGEHIFSGLVHRLFGYDNVGFHLSDQVVTMDFNGELSEKDIQSLEWEANRAITENRTVTASFPPKQELAALDYRSKIEIDGPVRIITIDGYDCCACCAPHVRHTGEIGLLKVVDFRRYKSGMRLSILCGFRALMDYRIKENNATAVSNLLSVPKEEIGDATARLKADYDQSKAALAAATSKMMAEKIQTVPRDFVNVCLFEDDLDSGTMRFCVNQLTGSHPGFCGIFSGSDESGYRYIIGSLQKDSRQIGALLTEQLHAKGGGKPEMIQGSISASRTEIKALFDTL